MEETNKTKFAVVTCSVNPEKTLQYWSTWRKKTKVEFPLVLVVSGMGTDPGVFPEEVARAMQHGDEFVMREAIDGTINPFVSGIEAAFTRYDPEIIACLHDDVAIEGDGDWVEEVLAAFAANPKAILAGFGGGRGLGSHDIYNVPYETSQLARRDFISNLRDAELHGTRVKKVTKVACLDGLSQIGKSEFIWECYKQAQILGIKHHAYDSLFGAWAYAAGFDTLMIPVTAHHAGGQTAVGSAEYNEWTSTQPEGSDAGMHKKAHEIMYEECRGILPFFIQE